MAKLGVDRVVIAKILNHAEPEVTAVYDRHRYDAEKKLALNAWGAELERLVDPSRAGSDTLVQMTTGGRRR